MLFLDFMMIFSIPFVLIGLLIVWITPIRKNFVLFRRINLFFICLLVAGMAFSIIIFRNIGLPYVFNLLQILLIAISLISLLAGKRSSERAKEAPNRTVTSKRNLKSWYVFMGIVFVIGFASYLIDFLNPSMMDQYTNTNDSARMILLGTFVVLALIGLGARFSYQKYSRVNQADLIADAIKTQVQSFGTAPGRGESETKNTEDRLRKLESLLSSGLVSQEEYGQKKKEIIDSI